VGLFLGEYPAVILYDLNTAKELFSQDNAAGRPDSFVYKYRMLGQKLGLLFNDGEAWKTQRRFVLKTLKDFGFGKKGLEGVLVEEADKIGDLFRSKQNEPFLVLNLFNVAILNVLWTIVANHRYDLTDPNAQTLVKLITDSIQVEGLRFLFAVPVSRHFAPEWTGWNKQQQVVGETQNLMRRIVEEHKESYQEDNMRDFIDVYLREMKTGGSPDFNDEQLIVNAMDLFSAGSETTATTLAWAVAFMILHPEVQKEVQEELDREIGDRKPALEDIVRLPLTEATIMEIQRMGSIAPQGYHFFIIGNNPMKHAIWNTFVFSMLYYIMRDPEIWSEPERFNPRRFLNPEGKLVKHDHFVPFGVGKRQCLGESLAKSELFIIFTRLIQQFSFTESPDHPGPFPTPVPGFIMAPKPFYARAVPRL
ncbi:methyl farnesoate epoxidase, partial [Eurytemora carolleeae]|uniref:methyl farnesoate epoxidase n=1 Tax=Eurytemora carolleeae TaxID=1294199 RepID=UPI000C77CC81